MVRLVLVSTLSFSSTVDRAVDLQAEGGQPEIIGRADGQRDRGDRRDPAADADGAQGEPRLAVAEQAEREERRPGGQARVRRKSAGSPAWSLRGASTGS